MLGSKKIKALIVEDDPIFRDTIKKATEHVLELKIAPSIRDAKTEIKNNSFDLVLAGN